MTEKKKSSSAKRSKKTATSFQPKVVKSTSKQDMNTWLTVAVVFLLAVIIGGMLNTTSSGSVGTDGKSIGSVEDLTGSMKAKLSNGQDLIVHEGKTWLSVEGEPVELIVVNDSTCGAACDPAQVVGSLRTGITPALMVRTVDVASDEGKQLVSDFDLSGVPAYVFGDGIAKFERDGQKFIERASDVLIEKNGKYFLDPGKTGFKYGKFIKAPEFDLAGEPTRGNGGITVVEFTDFQCPFCKRFHDQNKALIRELVNDGTITYVTKDFPLGFHKESRAMHVAANCVYEADGIDTYVKFTSLLFDNQKEWSGAAGQEEVFARKYATSVGSTADIAACLSNADMDKEIAADQVEGGRYGVSGTPSVFIGTQVMPGAVGPDRIRAAIDAELAK